MSLLNEVDSVLVRCGQVGAWSVGVRAFGRLDDRSEFDRSVGVGRVDQLDGEIGRVRADCLNWISDYITGRLAIAELPDCGR